MSRLFATEARNSVGKWVALPIVCVVFISSSSVELTGVASWTIASQAAAATGVLVAPLAAGIAVIASSARFARSQKRRLREASVSITWAVVAHLSALLLWVVGAQVIGTVLYLLTRQITGFPNISLLTWLVVTWLGSAFAACLAYLLGYLLPGKWWLAPIVALLIYIGFLPINILPGISGTWLPRLYFYTDDQADIFTAIDSVTVVSQGLWYLGVAGALIAMLALVIQRQGSRSTVLSAVVAISIALVGLTGIAARDGSFSSGTIPVRYACSATTSPKLCVAAPFDSGERQLRTAFVEFFGKLPTTYERPSLLKQANGSYEVSPSASTKFFYLYDLSSGYAPRAVADYVQSYLAPKSCSTAEESFTAQIWTTWLAGGRNPYPSGAAESDLVDAASRFFSASESQRTAWLARNFEPALNCKLKYGDLSGI